MPVNFIELLKAYTKYCKSTLRVLGEETELFCVESRYWILERALSCANRVVTGLGIKLSDVDYADNIKVIAADPATAQEFLNEIVYFYWLLGLKINMAKTKVVDLNIQLEHQPVLYGQEPKKLHSFTNIGLIMGSRGGCSPDIQNKNNRFQAIFS
ncbi:hypothetical protein QYM36_000667 [Artemia franciscana]|uniref:Reverse transcriptase domain-containing protein n=1 Tax=Artemia franciscana TaxID=6661 RepID=A0AA88LCG7_ARTSF|nr:hypothetical protein QYM36_000667 [Artemia franciscana]